MEKTKKKVRFEIPQVIDSYSFIFSKISISSAVVEENKSKAHLN